MKSENARVARINFIVPPFARKHFSGGILCAFEYAHGLTLLGHAVNIVPILPTALPEWFSKPVGNILTITRKRRIKTAIHSALVAVRAVATADSKATKTAFGTAFTQATMSFPELLPLPAKLGLADWYLPQAAPHSDINIAFSFESARAAALLPGRGFYFLQHFDPYFKAEYEQPEFAETTAIQSYKLGLAMIANSSWLQKRLTEELPESHVLLCPNAIDHEVYFGEPRPPQNGKKIVLISYGGRNARWKGFHELAAAVSILRRKLVDFDIEWRVFGTALLPPSNDVAAYTPLGFLAPPQLAEEYRKADILLSASWYESFPLFPIEAMACGLAVVTTQHGTEEYAIHRHTAQIVPPRLPEEIAKGAAELILNPNYRASLAIAGHAISKEFTWERSALRLESILLDGCPTSPADEARDDTVR